MTGKPGYIWSGSDFVRLGSPDGDDGKSAYQLYLDAGGTLSQNDWLASHVGPVGPSGPMGPTGERGPVGAGIPAGGQYGWVLVKSSSASYDTRWKRVLLNSNPDLEYDLVGSAPANAATGGVQSVSIHPDGLLYKTHIFYFTSSIDALVVKKGFIGDLLVVGGGGASGTGGGGLGAGGGGAGALFYGKYAFGIGQHNVQVGNGGTLTSKNGKTTSFDNIKCFGGGAGGNYNASGERGGCGGGSGEISGVTSVTGTGGSGQRFPIDFRYANSTGVNGGSVALSTNITGTTQTYSVGGLGDQGSSAVGSGYGGGANGGQSTGAEGGPGIVVIRYLIAE